jgi:hypothetical protein
MNQMQVIMEGELSYEVMKVSKNFNNGRPLSLAVKNDL